MSGEEMVALLLEKGLIKSISDIYRLKVEHLLPLKKSVAIRCRGQRVCSNVLSPKTVCKPELSGPSSARPERSVNKTELCWASRRFDKYLRHYGQ